MTCQELIGFLGRYLDDELSAAVRRRFEGHLGVCPDCVSYLHSYRLTITLGRAACVDEEVPEEVPEDLVRAILAAR